jgi:DNA repair protein RadC
MTRRSSLRHRPILQDAVSGLAREVIRRRAMARHNPEVQQPKQGLGDGCGMIIRDAADVQKWALGRIAELEHEEAWVLVIDRQHRLVRARRVEQGNAGSTHLDLERVVRVASAPRAAGFILVHNHPSDIPKPGVADIDATHQLMELALQRGAPPMLDSVIVARTSHASLKDLGLMSTDGRAAGRRQR